MKSNFIFKINPERDKLTGEVSDGNYGTPVFLFPGGVVFWR